MRNSTMCPVKIILALVILWLSNSNGYAQNAYDIFVKDSVQSILNSDLISQKAAYIKVKAAINKLEKQYGYETNLKRRLLEPAYEHNDIDFFKQELTRLVKDHGFDVAYMTENENYYQALMKGTLAKWFREMYIRNHSEWLNNNFDKQVELRKLNTLNEKDQFLTSFAMQVLNIQGLDVKEQDAIKQQLAEYHYRNIVPVLDIAKTRNILPNEKNFATLQNGYDTTLIHNLQFRENMESVWTILFRYYKKAYLAHDITYVMFQNYDFYHYQHYGTQVFDSYTINQIPEQFRKNNDPIPVEDAAWLKALKKEFKWPE